MTIGRRALLTGSGLIASGLVLPALALWPCAVSAQEASGFRIDWQGGPQTPEVAASLATQISLVRALKIKPEIAAFFAAQVITVDLAADTATRAGPRGVFFEREPMPADNPVLLHELLHRYHILGLPQGVRNPEVIGFYEQAKTAGFPPTAYMLKNPLEFFAMTASVALHGKAARPPFTRDNLRARLPELYAWIVREFGLVV